MIRDFGPLERPVFTCSAHPEMGRLDLEAAVVHDATCPQVQQVHADVDVAWCPTCGGEGFVDGLLVSGRFVVEERCRRCHGSGTVPTVTVSL